MCNVKNTILASLEKHKAECIEIYDMHRYDIDSDCIIATARSSRNASSIANDVALSLKHQGHSVYTEGTKNSEWVFLECNGITLHLFLRAAREYYNIAEIIVAKRRQHIGANNN